MRISFFFTNFAANYKLGRLATFMAKILVVDDERAIRNTLKDILEFEGYTIDLAENGKVGLEKALATTYDLIYTDIKMPEMDGLEMLQAYRQAVKENGAEERQ